MELWSILLGGGILTGMAALLGVAATRRRDRSTDMQTRFAQNIELTKYVNGLIKEATDPLLASIDALETSVKKLTDRDSAIKNILRSFFQRLWFWDQHGREGRMPMPSTDDMATLDLDIEPIN